MWISGYTRRGQQSPRADLAVSTSETDDTLTIILAQCSAAWRSSL